jgi:hypothetical protein
MSAGRSKTKVSMVCAPFIVAIEVRCDSKMCAMRATSTTGALRTVGARARSSSLVRPRKRSFARRRRMLRSLERCAVDGTVSSIISHQQNTNFLVQKTLTISTHEPNLHQNLSLRYLILHRTDPIQVSFAPEPERYLNTSKQTNARCT